MEKVWYKSKTVQGALVFSALTFLVSVGWIPQNTYTELVQWASGFWTVYGARDALD